MADLDQPDETVDAVAGGMPGVDPDELTNEERDALNYADVEEEEFNLTRLFLEWAEEHLSVVKCTHLDKSTAVWCPEWWKHPEAVERLWAWFEARQEAVIDAADRADALSDWWLTHRDRHAAILFGGKAGSYRLPS
ncbi:DUF4913 domain-containing protein [Curtobacterium sp. MCBD17_008]|uniref:DUF4913 domain-containing protein n=1 Tax=Curtobacterium sp. MCBD17_008 TaxID=2175656 RepID=UPI0015E8D0F7|nr:DUF4913 domain-containing protein [Curtobacterium sp. MCBD17_008]